MTDDQLERRERQARQEVAALLESWAELPPGFEEHLRARAEAERTKEQPSGALLASPHVNPAFRRAAAKTPKK